MEAEPGMCDAGRNDGEPKTKRGRAALPYDARCAGGGIPPEKTRHGLLRRRAGTHGGLLGSGARVPGTYDDFAAEGTS